MPQTAQRDALATGARPAAPASTAGVTPAEIPGIRHECTAAPAGLLTPTTRSRRLEKDRRLMGIDVARGLALAGMMVVHLLPASTDSGDMSPAWIVSLGKAAAVFAVVAGVGIAFSTGRTVPYRGRRWIASVAALLVRALLIGAIGLALGIVVTSETAYIILPYYAVLFVLAIPFLRLGPGWLYGIAILIAIGMPILSHRLRADLPPGSETNPTFASLQDPSAFGTELALTGHYPALAWMAYVCLGLAIGRSRLSVRGVTVGITVSGVALALLAGNVSWHLLTARGGLAALTAVAQETMTLDRFYDYMVWGSVGTLPTTSSWWLAVASPHTTTPFDLLFTMGVALAVIGGSIIMARVIAPLLTPLAAVGSMPLTLYSAHLLLTASPFMPSNAGVEYLLQAVLLTAFAIAWRHRFARGPLEQCVWWVTDHVKRLIAGRRYRPTDAARHAARALEPVG